MSQATYNFTKNPPYPTLLQPGVPAYAFGSKNANLPVVRMAISKVQLTSNVATLTVQMLEGNIPAVGDMLTVTGTSTASGAFNTGQSPVALTGVTIDSTTGAGTITYALTHANVGLTTDAGLASVDVPEVTYAASGPVKSAAFALQPAKGQGRGITWAYNTPSAPASLSIQLEGAVGDSDAEYTTIGLAQHGTGTWTEVIATVPENINFVRLNITTWSGGSTPTIVAKISQS